MYPNVTSLVNFYLPIYAFFQARDSGN